MFLSHINMSLFLSLPSILSKTNKHIKIFFKKRSLPPQQGYTFPGCPPHWFSKPGILWAHLSCSGSRVPNVEHRLLAPQICCVHLFCLGLISSHGPSFSLLQSNLLEAYQVFICSQTSMTSANEQFGSRLGLTTYSLSCLTSPIPLPVLAILTLGLPPLLLEIVHPWTSLFLFYPSFLA